MDSIERGDEMAVSLSVARARLIPVLAGVASALSQSEAHRLFGYARWSDFVRERYQRSGRWLKDLAALHRLFQSLPGLREAVSGEDGGKPLGVSAAAAIGRVASSSTVTLWIDRGRSLSLAKLREEVRQSLQAGCDRPITDAQDSTSSNKGVLCAFHHLRGIHDGLASCQGTAPLGLTWTLGRDGAGGTFTNERRV